uniref:Integral membrane protein 2 n=1 Tax=Anopheles atroparvus TaxID=41427 RepID=A0A182IZ05_ANOAO
MTIITKPSAKKGEKSILPLVNPDCSPSAPADDGNSTASNIILLRRARQLSPANVAILLMVALLGISIGTIGGLYCYRQYVASRNHMRYHGFCKIPYDASNYESLYRTLNADRDDILRLFQLHARTLDSGMPDQSSENSGGDSDASSNGSSGGADDSSNGMADAFFREEFELGLSDEENYSKIDVPLFRGQRPARFLHDFKFNQSGIIDGAAGRCFIMPLDRETVLPPQSLRDLIQKMQLGYYNIDTSVLKKTMRVVQPELTDYTDVSPRITKECVDMKIYQLEKIVSGVYKRSTDIQERSKYAEFGGNHIALIDITNLDELN